MKISIIDKNGKQQTVTKKSGAKLTRYTPESNKSANQDIQQFIVSGWRINKRKEMVYAKCRTTRFSRETDNKGWLNSIRCELTNTETGEINVHWGLMNPKDGTVIISKINQILSPKSANGGFFGILSKNK